MARAKLGSKSHVVIANLALSLTPSKRFFANLETPTQILRFRQWHKGEKLTFSTASSCLYKHPACSLRALLWQSTSSVQSLLGGNVKTTSNSLHQSTCTIHHNFEVHKNHCTILYLCISPNPLLAISCNIFCFDRMAQIFAGFASQSFQHRDKSKP